MIIINTWYQNSGWKTKTGDTSLTVTQINPKKNYLILYIDYVKGDETVAIIQCGFRDVEIPEDIYFDYTHTDGSNYLFENKFILGDSLRRKVPIELHQNEEFIRISATLNNPNSSPGTLRIWIKPTD